MGRGGMAIPSRPASPAQVNYALRLLKQQGLTAPSPEEVEAMPSVEVSSLIDGLLAKRGKPVFYGNGTFSHWQKAAGANLTPIRQRTQFTCVAASTAMCLQALGVQNCDEDTVNQVLGAAPMRGATWEQVLATAQHYGVRATLTVPATLSQVKAWTDAGKPVMIGWNPEGREWSHASVIFDVQPCAVHGFMVHVADPNCPDPEQTVRILPKSEFYAKWYEKVPHYLVRRPALMLEREVTPEGRQVMAHALRPTPAHVATPTVEVPMSKQAKAPTPVVQKKDNKNVVQGEAPARRNPVVQGLIERGTAGAGKHKGKEWGAEYMALPVEEACGAEYMQDSLKTAMTRRTAGYTNYWTYFADEARPEGGFDDQQWSALIRVTRAILEEAAKRGIVIAGPEGTGRPVVTEEVISLNGDRASKNDHETFYFMKAPSQEDIEFHQELFGAASGRNGKFEVAKGFCKTNQKPYDAVVVSILAAAQRISKGYLKARTDGGAAKKVLAHTSLEEACGAEYMQDHSADPTKNWSKALEDYVLHNPLSLGDRWDIVKMSRDEFKVEAVESVMYLHAKTYVGEAVVSIVGRTAQGKTFKKQVPLDKKTVPTLIALLKRAKTAAVAGPLPSEVARLRSAGLEDACWEGYEAVGMKEQGGKQVPNCVPTKTAARYRNDNRFASDKRAAHVPYQALIEADTKLYNEVMRPVASVVGMLAQVKNLPNSAKPFLNQLRKLMDALRAARKESGEVRQMVERNQYWSPDDPA